MESAKDSSLNKHRIKERSDSWPLFYSMEEKTKMGTVPIFKVGLINQTPSPRITFFREKSERFSSEKTFSTSNFYQQKLLSSDNSLQRELFFIFLRLEKFRYCLSKSNQRSSSNTCDVSDPGCVAQDWLCQLAIFVISLKTIT